MEIQVGKSKLEMVKGDITKQDTDAIVNAANSGLRAGSGVNGAIHRAGGPAIMDECRRIGGCPTGSAVLTNAGQLKCKKVIHAVGPVWHGGSGGEPAQLESAHRKCLELATANGLKSLAFCAISTGVYGYPMEAAADLAIRTVMDYLKDHPEIELVRFVLFDDMAYRTFEAAARRLSEQ